MTARPERPFSRKIEIRIKIRKMSSRLSGTLLATNPGIQQTATMAFSWFPAFLMVYVVRLSRSLHAALEREAAEGLSLNQ